MLHRRGRRRVAPQATRYHHVAGDKPLHQLAKLGPVGSGAGDLLAEYLPAPGRLQLAHLAARRPS
jgi:hypothetical protein